MKTERKDFDRIMELLDQVVTRIGSQHAAPYDFGTGIPLYRAEIHTVQAIGENPGINVTTLAERMGVTKGAMSQTLSKLARKGLVEKKAAADNERETLLELTDLGLTAHRAHERFHMDMYDMAQRHFGDRLPEKVVLFATVLRDLNQFLDTVSEEGKKA